MPFVPPQASDIAGQIDLLIFGLTVMTVVFTAGIFIAIIYMAVKYRRGSKADRSNAPLHNLKVELAWTIGPLIIALGIFAWGAAIYVARLKPPQDATEVYVTGKQWMWKLQHPEGRWEMNELHIPVGKPVVLTMTSEDVIHSFFVPAFRVKQDVIPGQYTRLWFTPTEAGSYHLFCSQFCGTFHSTMTGTVTVMDRKEYEDWLNTGSYQQSFAAKGEGLFRQYGCSGCHGANSSVKAPPLNGIFGKPVAVQIPKEGVPLENIKATTLIADQRYIHDSIVLPEKEVAAGYRPIMPTFKGQLSEEQILQLVAYIKTLGTSNGTANGSSKIGAEQLSAEDYKARVGFTPKNIDRLTAPQKGMAGDNTGGANGVARGSRSGRIDTPAGMDTRR